MIHPLLETLLRLGHSTSVDLGFAHRSTNIGFGEETITETNLLALQRLEQVCIRAFCKRREAKNGADWEWRILGDSHGLRMRVQAKRVDRHGFLRGIRYVPRNGNKPQLDLLIDDAEANDLLPVYCLYCAEKQRTIWKRPQNSDLETGCLLGSASDIKRLWQIGCSVHRFQTIEEYTVPWHYLLSRTSYAFGDGHALVDSGKAAADEEGLQSEASDDLAESRLLFPTVDELNDGFRRTNLPHGATISPPRSFEEEVTLVRRESAGPYLDRGIRGVLVVDVRSRPETKRRGLSHQDDSG